MVKISYDNNGLLTYTKSEWLQGEFNILMEIFGWVRLEKKSVKMVCMVRHLYHASGRHS